MANRENRELLGDHRKLLQISGLFGLLEQELIAPENSELLKDVFYFCEVDHVTEIIIGLRRDICDTLIDGACPNAAYCMDGAVCYLQGQCATAKDEKIIRDAHNFYLRDQEDSKNGRA